MAEDIIFFIFKFLLCIFIFLIGGAFVKVLLDIVRGRNKHDIFKKQDITGSDIDILEKELSRIKGYHKIFKTKDYLVFINEYYIDLILFCDYYGMITGNEEDIYWNFNSDSKKTKIDNPVLTLNYLKQNLINKTGINKIRAYILLGGNTRLNLHISKTNILRRGNAYYMLSQRRDKKKYTSDEIDLIYEKIKM